VVALLVALMWFVYSITAGVMLACLLRWLEVL
jgi:hypothetical protein